MERSELEHISILPGRSVLFQTTCSCGDSGHSLGISVDKEVRESNGIKYIDIDMEMYFQVQWNDFHSWENELHYINDNSTIFEKLVAHCKYKLSWFAKRWKRIKTAWQILWTGSFREDESFLFRSNKQALAVYKAMGDAVESFRNGDKETDELCDKFKNITKCKIVGS